MNVLLWRQWCPQYDYPAAFSALEAQSIGGTCAQLLWHAEALVALRHRVQVLGATHADVTEHEVDFVGAANRSAQEDAISSGRVRTPDVIMLEGAFAAAQMLRGRFPGAKIVHVGQNIDRYGTRAALKVKPFVDLYALVSPGHLALNCVRFPQIRHKFALLRNIVPWERFHGGIEPQPVEDRIVWVGAWGKKGLRQWAETMETVLADFPSYRWSLFGPSHGAQATGGMPAHLLKGLDLPSDRVEIRSLPLRPLLEEMGRARIVLVSLGNETACISALDAHAMGRPVVSGNDMIFKYVNPEGTGIRVTTARERYDAIRVLIQDAELGDELGVAGKQLIRSDYTEANQRADLARILSYLEIRDRLGAASANPPPDRFIENLSYFEDRVRRKARSLF